MVLNLGPPLGLHIVERVGADDREGDQKHVRLWVRERPQSVVVFLAGRVPEAEVDGLAIDHHVGRVVVKDSGNVLAWEGVGGVGDE